MTLVISQVILMPFFSQESENQADTAQVQNEQVVPSVSAENVKSEKQLKKERLEQEKLEKKRQKEEKIRLQKEAKEKAREEARIKKEEERQAGILDNEQLSNLLYDLSKAFILHDTDITEYDESISNSFKNIITTSIKLHQLDRELYSVKINDLNKRKKITNKDVEELLSLLDKEYPIIEEN